MSELERGVAVGVAVGVVSTGALEQLEVELGHARAQWISREQEVREMCTRRQGNVQEKT